MGERSSIFMSRREVWNQFIEKVKSMGILIDSLEVDISLQDKIAEYPCDELLDTVLAIKLNEISEAIGQADRMAILDPRKKIISILKEALLWVRKDYNNRPDTDNNRAIRKQINTRE